MLPHKAAAPAADEHVRVVRFDVPLPIDGLIDKQVQGQVEQALRKLPKEGPRPTFVFEFRPKAGTAGEGSDFARAQSLARFLSGERLAGVRTVAWVPVSVKGHAVLPALACEQIIIQRDAELGAAGQDERGAIDALLRRGYAEIADRRKTMPTAVALGLLDKDLAVYKVRTPDGLRYELPDSLATLRQEGKVTSEETFFQPGDPHVLSGAQMRELGFATHLADDRRSLATALEVPAAMLQQELVPEGGWRPLRIDLSGPVHKKVVNFLLRTIDDHERRDDFNLLFVHINSGGGDLDQSRRLAERLSSMGPKIHTVAFVDASARGDAALVATSCDELLVTPGAMLGGPGETALTDDELDHVRDAVASIARASGRDWSLTMALIDPRVQVFRATRALGGDVRYLSAEEHDALSDRDHWNRDNVPLPTASGITGQTAEEWGLARTTVQNLDDAKSLLQIEGELVAARPNWALGFIEWLADPRIAGILLFVGWFALMIEVSSPGVGVAGLHRGALLPPLFLVAIPARHGRLARNSALRRRHHVPGRRTVCAARHGHFWHRRRPDDHRLDRARQPDLRRADQQLSAPAVPGLADDGRRGHGGRPGRDLCDPPVPARHAVFQPHDAQAAGLPRSAKKSAAANRSPCWTICTASGAFRPRRWCRPARPSLATTWSMSAATASSYPRARPWSSPTSPATSSLSAEHQTRELRMTKSQAPRTKQISKHEATK